MKNSDHIFVVTLSGHRNFGHLLVPYFAGQIPGEPFIRLLRKASQHDLDDSTVQLTPEEVRIVKIAEKCSDEKLILKFCPGKPASEIQNLIRNEAFRQTVISYIEGALAEVLELLKSSNIPVYQKREKYANLYEEDKVNICFKDTDAVFNFHRTAEETRYFLTLRNGRERISLLKRKVEILVNEPCYIYYQNKIYFFDHISATKMIPFLEKEYISIPRKMEDRYFETFILNAVKCQEIDYSGFEVRETIPHKGATLSLEKDLNNLPVFVLYFSYNGERLRLKEGERRVVMLNKTDNQYIFETFSRDFLWEANQLKFLESLGMNGRAEGLRLDFADCEMAEDPLYLSIEWLSKHADELALADISVSQAALNHPYYLGIYDLKIAVENKIDWFDIEMMVRIGEWHIPFIRFKRLILGHQREFKLPNGEIFILPEAWFAQFAGLLSFGKPEARNIVLKPFHFMLLSEKFSAGNPALQEQIGVLRNQKMSVQEIPKNLKAHLRNYQHDGYNWLYHLWQNKLNGCLADDMGLGKTLQTLVLLLKLKRGEQQEFLQEADSKGQLNLFGDLEKPVKEPQPASMIVLPVSLLHNWENEIRKFVPSLRFYTYSGVKRREKLDFTKILYHFDLILTTYGTVRNDTEILSRHTFYYLILDESQNIKNAESKSYRAVASIPSRYRLSLTGTPIENSLSDLWSQMNFLNPGLLGSFKFFRENFLLPIEKEHNQEASTRLNQLIGPFILRRTKEEVAADLPPIMEELLTIEMTPEQQELYDSEKSSVRNYLLNNMDELGPRNTAFIVLQALTRLRQIAIHPRLVDPGSDMESGKFNEILSMLEILVAENHKILIFSSFVKHLNLLDEACRRMNWGYCRLTGQTIDRKSVIEEFQSKRDKNIFLISLKAGGVGLNLTAADYIFITDPWWNPAAEMQAISRAHRIGQDKKVFVYRFISEKSIEEKIQMLQVKKAALASEFINRNDPFAILGKEEMIQLFE